MYKMEYHLQMQVSLGDLAPCLNGASSPDASLTWRCGSMSKWKMEHHLQMQVSLEDLAPCLNGVSSLDASLP